MKYVSFIFIVCFCALSVNGQSKLVLSDLLERLKQNYSCSISEVFSAEELVMLNQHLSANSSNTIKNNALVDRYLSSTKGNSPVSVAVIKPEDLSVQLVGSSPLTQFEGAGITRVNPNDGAFIIDNSNTLYLRGVNTNNYTSIGQINNLPPNESIVGAERISTNEIYVISTNGTNSSHLHSLNTVTLTATPIGGNNGLVLPINLARDASDNLFTLDIDNDVIYGIDKTNGIATPVGPAGFDANFGQGMSFDPVTDQIILTAFNNSIFDAELRTLDTNTGETFSLGTLTPGEIDQYGWSDIFDNDLLKIENNKFFNFKFYPNPSSNVLNLQANDIINAIKIYTISGQTVLYKEINKLKDYVIINHLAPGVYVLEVMIAERKENFKLLIE